MNDINDVHFIVSAISERSKSAIQYSDNVHTLFKNKEIGKKKELQSSPEPVKAAESFASMIVWKSEVSSLPQIQHEDSYIVTGHHESE